jgi:hypothetical protein
MIKILMDECLPKKLKYRIEELEPNFFVKTTPDTEYREALWDGMGKFHKWRFITTR